MKKILFVIMMLFCMVCMTKEVKSVGEAANLLQKEYKILTIINDYEPHEDYPLWASYYDENSEMFMFVMGEFEDWICDTYVDKKTGRIHVGRRDYP